jgi:hypothetical protein
MTKSEGAEEDDEEEGYGEGVGAGKETKRRGTG